MQLLAHTGMKVKKKEKKIPASCGILALMSFELCHLCLHFESVSVYDTSSSHSELCICLHP